MEPGVASRRWLQRLSTNERSWSGERIRTSDSCVANPVLGRKAIPLLLYNLLITHDTLYSLSHLRASVRSSTAARLSQEIPFRRHPDPATRADAASKAAPCRRHPSALRRARLRPRTRIQAPRLTRIQPAPTPSTRRCGLRCVLHSRCPLPATSHAEAVW